MLNAFDDFPIHPSADPIATPATADINHYDRYWFNGHHRDGHFYFGAAMGHYPVRGIIDAAFSIIKDGVEHSVFASGAMPLDRSTSIGPIRIEVIEPMRTLRVIVEPNAHDISCDLVFEATTIAVEEPRQQRRTAEGVLLTDHTRLTQWGQWGGTVTVDGDELHIHATDVPGTRDRSWGIRPVGEQVQVIRQPMPFQVFWLWAPLHFGDRFTHLALHEHEDGRRWLETALILDPITAESSTFDTTTVRECHDIDYHLEWEPGRREIKRARLSFHDPVDGLTHIDIEKLYTFRMRGIGYWHPYWGHGSHHGALETGRESTPLDRFDPTEFSNIHLQNVVVATMGDRRGIGVVEQIAIGPHQPSKLTGLLDGHPG